MRRSQIPYQQSPFNLASHSYPMSYSQQLSPKASCLCQPAMSSQYQSYIEQIPYEKKTIDYYPQEKIEYIPQEQRYQDFLEVQHELDYVPVPILEKYTEQVPLERYDTYYDYVPRTNTIVRSTGSNYVPPPNQQYQYARPISQYSQYSAYPAAKYGPSHYGRASYGPTTAPMSMISNNQSMYHPRLQSPFSNRFPYQANSQFYPPYRYP